MATSRRDLPDFGQRRSAAELDRDARAEAERLKTLLGNQPPWSRDVEVARQKCRSLHLLILFSHPLSPHAQSLDSLWHHTTYLLIQAYRELIASLERALSASQGQGQGRQNRRGGGAGGGSPAQADWKKALTRFRQALASEETFYRNLISRIVRFYSLADISDCKDYLTDARIPLGERDGYRDTDDSREDDHFAGPGPAMSMDEKKTKLSLVYKGLICLGDIERYKEQYGEPQQQRRTQAKIRNVASSDEKFANAKRYYEIARGLLPDDGAAFNQLAVISTYLGDDFATAYYYFRALTIRNAFRGADSILYKFLGKATERWRGKRKESQGEIDENEQVANWKEEVVALVGVLYTKAGFTFIPILQSSILERLSNLLKSRKLGAEQIVKLTTIVIGSHHRARSTAGVEQEPKLVERSHDAEAKALGFLIAVFTVILRIGAEEVEEARAMLGDESALAIEGDDDEVLEAGDHLPQYISAVLRRILPSLRLVSKWLKLDLEYLSRLEPFTSSGTDTTFVSFLDTYKRFISAVASVFPITHLPSLSEPLEEDLDMRGFAPLQRGITLENGMNAGTGVGTTLERGVGSNLGVPREVHPNEEQLKRLADLQVDAKLIMQSELGASLFGLAFPQFEGLTAGSFGVSRQGEEDADLASVSTETEDDPVNMAMRATLGAGSSVDGESVHGGAEVWEFSLPAKPTPNPIPQPAETGGTPNVTPSRPKATALDLLQNLMLESSPSPSHTPPAHVSSPLNPGLVGATTANTGHYGNYTPSHVPQQGSGSGSALLFGGAVGGGQAAGNIWSMTREESEKGHRRASGSGLPAAGTAAGTNIAAIWNTSNPLSGTDSPLTPSTAAAGQNYTSSPAHGYPYTHPTHVYGGQAPALLSSGAPAASTGTGGINSGLWGLPNSTNPSVPFPSYSPSSQSPFHATYGGVGDVPYYAQAAYYGKSGPHYGGWSNGNGRPP